MTSSAPLRFCPSFFVTLALTLFLAVTANGAEDTVANGLPIISQDQLEFHGELYGQAYWVRLLSPDQRFGGNRMMQLVYVPRKPEDNGSTVNEDHPFLLVNSKAQLIAWNERGSCLSGFEYRTNRSEPGYAINIERSRKDKNGDLVPIEVSANFTSPTPIWDAHLAPLMLALTYQPNASQTTIPAVDFFGAASPLSLSLLTIRGKTIFLPNGQQGTIKTDNQGRLKTISDANGKTIFSVSKWLSDPRK